MKRRSMSVTSDLRRLVFVRDGWRCMAPVLDPNADACRDRWGSIEAKDLTVDHVKDAARLGVRAPSDTAHLVTLCHYHNGNGWASAHRALERAYLRSLP